MMIKSSKAMWSVDALERPSGDGIDVVCVGIKQMDGTLILL